MEGIFYFGEQLRWNLGFETPNIAGAIIAVAIAFVLPFTSKIPNKTLKRLFFALLLVVEILLWFVLAKTYSRGALIAAAVCFVCCNAFLLCRSLEKYKVWEVALIKIIIISAIISYTGFSNRISPEYIGNDGSTSGRIALWAGGLKMIYQAPIYGWGVDKSGEEYINWFQDFSDDRKYAGMVNSYLHIAVERGLPTLFAILAILAFSLFANFRLWKRNRDLFALALGLALLSLCISNIFSTLWIVSSIQCAGIMLLVICLTYPILKTRSCLYFRESIMLSIISAFSICLCLYFAGFALQPKFISKHSDHITLASDKRNAKRIAIIVDNDTFGKYFGKTIRQAYVNMKSKNILDVYYKAPSKVKEYDEILITGGHAPLFQPPSSAKVIYINPIGNPLISSVIKNTIIYLPHFDIYNQNARWIKKANVFNIPYSFIDTPSNQIPEIFLQSLLLSDN